MKPAHFEWDAYEHPHIPKAKEWYIGLGIIVTTIGVVAIMFGNVFFAIFIVMAGIALGLFANRVPPVHTYSISERGISVGDKMYPYVHLDSFWIDFDDEFHPRIIVKSRKSLMTHIIMPLGQEANEVRDDIRMTLLTYIAEEEHNVPVLQKMMERLGF